MHEEQLFEMVNEAVKFAKTELENSQTLQPFAMTLFENGNVLSLKSDAALQEQQYERLIAMLKERVAEEPKITAVILVARVTIPAHCKAPVDDGIRIHLEERHKSGEKIAGRFLYVPYRLYTDSSARTVSTELYSPIPVAFPAEIFL